MTFSGSTLEVGATRSLFNASVSGADAFDVTADGQRFLMLTSREQESAAPLTLIQNWTAALARWVRRMTADAIALFDST